MVEVRARKLHGSPHMKYAIWIKGVEVYSQLSPMSEAEVEERVRSYLNPPAVPAVRDVRGKAGRPNKVARTNNAGFKWIDQIVE